MYLRYSNGKSRTSHTEPLLKTMNQLKFVDMYNSNLLKSSRSENHNPVFIFLIEALGPISCKKSEQFFLKMSQKPISCITSNSAYSIRHEYAGQSVPREG